MPFGAQLQEDGLVRFGLWAPSADQVDLCLDGGNLSMAADGTGWFELVTSEAPPGSRYAFRIDKGMIVPDPASRFQPEDVHGPSEVIDPRAFVWEDGHWRGRPWTDSVIYELHVGTFTEAGDFAAVAGKLDYLVDLGVTALELMPVADFPGRYNWGYDGAFLFAPDSRYGRPEALKSLIDAAHARGLMVFMDVVYNHFGPEGNYLYAYAPQFFSQQHHTPWGAAINFDGETCHEVRRFFIHNALYWLIEYHLDGLRLDAVHAIMDDSEPGILVELAETVRREIGPDRHVHLLLENEDNGAHYLCRKERNVPWYEAQWNDDIHHALHVLLTGEDRGYYIDFADDPLMRLGRCLAEGFAWQGEPSPWRQNARRGEPSSDLPPDAFIAFLQNHDQIGNRAFGERIGVLAATDAVRAATALLLLAPSPPLLFMGQEWGTTRPYLFFCDFEESLKEEVTRGRREEFSRFPEFADPARRNSIPDPTADTTFEASRLDWHVMEAPVHQEWLTLHRTLLRLRHSELLPLLGHGPAQQTKLSRLAGGALNASWQFSNGTRLELLANLCSMPCTGVEHPVTGRLLYGTHSCLQRGDESLPPWSVFWYLNEETTAV